MFYLHAYINYTIPPNLFFFLKNLAFSMLKFLPNLPGMGFSSTDYWQADIPQKILDVDGYINFSKSTGSVIIYMLVYVALALLVKLLTTKFNMNRPFRNLIEELYQRRVKFGFMH